MLAVVLLVTEVALAGVLAGSTAPASDGDTGSAATASAFLPGSTIPTSERVEGRDVGQPRSVDEIRAALAAERTGLEGIEDELVEQARLYDRLDDLQTDRAALRAEVGESVSQQRSAIDDLDDPFFPFQKTPARLADLEYELWRTNRTISELREVLAEERRVVERLIERVRGENDTIATLETPLRSGVTVQWESQLDGLETLKESLREQSLQLLDARFRVARLLALVSHYQDIWRDVDSDERAQVLARIDREYEDVTVGKSIRDSRFESQVYVVALLTAHHRARMETAAEYVGLLRTLETDLADLEDPPTGEAVARVQETITGRVGEFERLRTLLENESTVASLLRTRMAEYETLLDERRTSIDDQFELLDRLRAASTVKRQQAIVDRFDAEIAREREVLLALRETVRAEQAVVQQLYDTGGVEGRSDSRVVAYLGVRDRIADLLAAILELEGKRLDDELQGLRAKDRALGRLRYARGVQDLWAQIPDLVDGLEDDVVDSALLRNWFEDQREAFDLLSDLRTEADVTVESQVTFLESVADDLETVETAVAARPTLDPPRSTPTTGSIDEGGDPGAGFSTLFLLLLLGLWIATIVWLVSPYRDRFG